MLASETPYDLNADLALLVETIREAGALASTLFRQRLRGWNKSDGSPVSEADLTIDRLLKIRLTEARPQYGWLSEESPDDLTRLTQSHVWIVDPIDGTRAFLSGRTHWCIGVALVAAGRPVIAAVYRPLTEDLYTAVRAAGCHLNGMALTIAPGATLKGARVIGSKTALKPLLSLGIEPVTLPELPMLLRACLVAAGDYEAMIATGNKNDWDLAAGDLIVNEAGGMMTDGAGALMIYNRREAWQSGLAGGGGAHHAKIIAAMRAP